MSFKVGDKIRRKPDYRSSWWGSTVSYYGRAADSIFTVGESGSSLDMIKLKEMPTEGEFAAYRFELVPTVNKRFAKELEE